MVIKKYIILAYSNDKTFDIPRQLVEINEEPLIKRTIRLLKENGIEDITITAKGESFNDLGVKIYEPKKNNYDYLTGKGYWLNAFPFELMNDPVCFIWGDVYFSEEAIKTIVETETDKNLFFCSYNNHNKKYIKEHDEPFAYKVADTDLFKEHINIVKRLYDEGKTCRHPIVWEVYRSMNGLDVNEHIMADNFVAINDITCDIDSAIDVDKIKEKIGGDKMIKCEVVKEFTLERFDELKNIQRRRANTKGKLYVGDTFECDKEMADYLMGANKDGQVVVKVIEVEPETINKDNVLEKLNESLEKIEKEELIETIPVINKNGIIVDRVVKDKPTKKKKHSKK